MLALAGFVGLVLVQEWQRIITGMWGIIPTAALLNLLGFGAGYAVGVACRCSVADRFTLAVEFAVRNVVIAAVIAITILGQVEFAIFATAYFLIEVPMMLIAVAAFRLVSDRSQTTTTRMTVVEVEAEAP
jgi:ACR3 family arsenite efflux pump ArsB